MRLQNWYQDKTLNTLFRLNHNASKLDVRIQNEDIPQDNKRFAKRNGKLSNFAKSVTSKKEELPSNAYQTHNDNLHQESIADTMR